MGFLASRLIKTPKEKEQNEEKLMPRTPGQGKQRNTVQGKPSLPGSRRQTCSAREMTLTLATRAPNRVLKTTGERRVQKLRRLPCGRTVKVLSGAGVLPVTAHLQAKGFMLSHLSPPVPSPLCMLECILKIFIRLIELYASNE